MKGTVSHHSHSGQFCKHADGTLEGVVQEAIRQNFEVFCLTEHVPRYRTQDLYPEEEGMTSQELLEQFEAFLVEAHRLKNQYSSQIRILVGAETEYISEADLDNLALLLSSDSDMKSNDSLDDKGFDNELCSRHYRSPELGQWHGIEFLVGSLHHVNEIPIDFDKETYARALESFDMHPVQGETGFGEKHPGEPNQLRLVKFLCCYFDNQHRLLELFRPEIIGHFDLCRLYTPDLRFRDYPDVWKKVERNVELAISYGALFELNAAAFRKGWTTAYPGKDVSELILLKGGRFTLSDDSHGPHAVGLNYHRLQEYVEELGVKEIWALRQSEKVNDIGRKVEAECFRRDSV